jgi:ubiquinol-cytochrome c reductase iron-sulfur subunit
MSDTGQTGAEDSGGTSWPEYLTGGDGPAASSTGASSASASGGEEQPEGRGVRHRVIGTPAPAEARTMLAGQGAAGGPARTRELPPGPPEAARAKRVERLVAALFVLAMVAGFAFLVLYSTIGVGSITKVVHSNIALGGSLSVVFLCLGIGAVLWVRQLMPAVEWSEARHPMHSTPQEKEAFEETFEEGAEASQFVSRPLIRRTLIAATVPLAIAPLFLLRDLGPLPGTSLDYTVWRKGLRLIVYGTGRPISPAEFSSPGSIISVVPEGYEDNDDALAKAAAVIIKFRPGELFFGPSAKPGAASAPNLVVPNWTVDNIVAYSKICTHLGCPAALYEQTTHHILCPCHQSTFDAVKGAQVIFGPATRPLPQLPLGVDAQGYLIATGDFNQPVGPTFWERS